MLISFISGFLSSILVVIIFNYIQEKRHLIIRNHIVYKIIVQLFLILSIFRIAIKSEAPSDTKSFKILKKEFEFILNYNDLDTLVSKIQKLDSIEHRKIFDQLKYIGNSLSSWFAISISHKTVEAKVSGYISIIQEEIDLVLRNYITFPEFFDDSVPEGILVNQSVDIMNLIEDCFNILDELIKLDKDTK